MSQKKKKMLVHVIIKLIISKVYDNCRLPTNSDCKQYLSLSTHFCVRGTRTQPLICVVREVFSRLHFRRRHTFASLWGAWLRFASLWRTNARGDLCVVGVHYSSVWWGVIIFHRSSLKRAERLLKVCQLKSVKFYFGLSMVRHCPWKMCATPRACIKPGCFARRPLCHKVNLPSCVARWPLCYKVNQPRYDARRRHFIMTCDIYGIEINKLNLLCPSVQHRKVILGL